MGTQYYNFNYWAGSNGINIAKDENVSLDEIDAALKNVSDAAMQAVSDEHDAALIREGDIIDDFDDAIENAVDDIMIDMARRNEFAGCNIVMIGDSYTYGTGSNTHAGVTRNDYKTSGDAQRWSSLFCTALGATEFNYAFGATGFIKSNTTEAGYTSDDLRFIKQVELAESHMTADEISATKLVVIAGGINDANHNSGTGAQMQAAAQACCETARTLFPNALIMLIPMMYHTYEFSETHYNFWMRIKLGGMQAGKNVLVVDNAWTWLFGWNAWCSGIHPNGDGHYKLAEFALSALNGGNDQGTSWDVPTFETGFAGSGGGESGDTYFNFLNGRVSLRPCYVWGNLSSGNTQFATAPAWACPRQNQYMPIIKGNEIVGVCAVVASNGHMNAIVSSSVSGGFYIQGGTWDAYGRNPS